MKAILLFAVLCTSIYSFAQFDNTQSQYFDGADTTEYSIHVVLDTAAGNIWQIGPPQKTIFSSPFSSPNVIVTDTLNTYPANNLSRFTFGLDYSFFEWGVLAIQWTQKLDMHDNNAGGILEFTTDGIDWQNAFDNPYVYNFYGFNEENINILSNEQTGFTGQDTTWKDIWLCFDYSWAGMQDSLYFRYTFYSDSLAGNDPNEPGREGWMIDNLLAHTTITHTIGEIQQEEYMSVNPVPAKDRINIQLKKLNEFHVIEQIQLLDMDGRVVKEYGLSPTRFFIDVNDVANGSYILKVKSNLRTETKKILIGH